MILENENQDWVGADYINLVCYKDELPIFYMSGRTYDEIRNIIISPNTCTEWTHFINSVSPVATEQKQFSNWVKKAFLVAFIFLIALIVILVLNQFVLDN